MKQGIEAPEGQNDLKRMQLRELAALNGTLREDELLRYCLSKIHLCKKLKKTHTHTKQQHTKSWFQAHLVIDQTTFGLKHILPVNPISDFSCLWSRPQDFQGGKEKNRNK